jgi:hypothetical protein
MVMNTGEAIAAALALDHEELAVDNYKRHRIKHRDLPGACSIRLGNAARFKDGHGAPWQCNTKRRSTQQLNRITLFFRACQLQ